MMMRWLVQLLARLKGGSGWSPQGGSGWYFPQAKTLTEHGKYFLYSDGYERSSMLGFRCVADPFVAEAESEL